MENNRYNMNMARRQQHEARRAGQYVRSKTWSPKKEKDAKRDRKSWKHEVTKWV